MYFRLKDDILAIVVIVYGRHCLRSTLHYVWQQSNNCVYFR